MKYLPLGKYLALISDIIFNFVIIIRKKPASLEKKNSKGESALHTAAVKGDDKTVLKLLEQGANPNTVDNAGWSPLHEASIAGLMFTKPLRDRLFLKLLIWN